MPVEQHEATAEQNEQESRVASIEASQLKNGEPKAKTNGTSSQPKEQLAVSSTPNDPLKGSGAQPTASPAASASGVTSTSTRHTTPAIPIIPALPKHGSKPSVSEQTPKDIKPESQEAADSSVQEQISSDAAANATSDVNGNEAESSVPVRAPPTSWANLFTRPSPKAPVNETPTNGSVAGDAPVHGDGATAVVGAIDVSKSTFSKTNANSLAEAIQAYQVGSSGDISFLEPRGLINTGNMCYMNSVSALNAS